MPSPIGHLIAGAAVAWLADRRAPAPPAGRRVWTLTVLCAAIAALADADLVFPMTHRGASHSVAAVALVTILAMAVTGWVKGRVDGRIVAACAVAYASHLALDWLSVDTFPPRGIQALWPLTDRWFISELDLFPRIERRDPFSAATLAANARAALVEILVLAPVAALVWWGRRRRAQAYT